jgi:hypothetical protein
VATRLSQFEAIDQPALQPLPAQSYIYTLVKQVCVHIDYHVEVEKHYYSVPYTLIKQKLEAHVTGQLVTLYHQGLPVAAHPRSCRQGAHTTVDAHMPVVTNNNFNGHRNGSRIGQDNLVARRSSLLFS